MFSPAYKLFKKMGVIIGGMGVGKKWGFLNFTKLKKY